MDILHFLCTLESGNKITSLLVLDLLSVERCEQPFTNDLLCYEKYNMETDEVEDAFQTDMSENDVMESEEEEDILPEFLEDYYKESQYLKKWL